MTAVVSSQVVLPLPEPLADVVVVSGSPSPTSRSRSVGVLVAELLGGGTVIDLGQLDAEALLGRRTDPQVDEAIGLASNAEILVVATPVYRATYSALTKTLFDLMPLDSLVGTIVVPVAAGGSKEHSLVIEHGLRPLISSLGGLSISGGVYASQTDFREDGQPLARLIDRAGGAAEEAHRLVRSSRNLRPGSPQ